MDGERPVHNTKFLRFLFPYEGFRPKWDSKALSSMIESEPSAVLTRKMLLFSSFAPLDLLYRWHLSNGVHDSSLWLKDLNASKLDAHMLGLECLSSLLFRLSKHSMLFSLQCLSQFLS